jgi:seryl-tRNA synthetase
LEGKTPSNGRREDPAGLFSIGTACVIIRAMLDPKFVLENKDLVLRKIGSRGITINLDEFSRLSDEKKKILRKAEELRFERNKASDLIAQSKREKKDASSLIAEMRTVGDRIKAFEDELRQVEEKIRLTLLHIPNVPDGSVPQGKSSEDNLEVRRSGPPPEFPFTPQPHWDIGTQLGILDFERAGKIAGSRFTVYLGAGARLERALINFMLDIHTRERGYKEVLPPFIANAESLTGTGNLPKFAADLFKLEGTSWYLIPTAEVPLTNYYREEILEAAILPQRFVAYTPCFRSEAGSYGKDIRGLIRQHQFNKVEMMTFSLPEKSFEELEKMTTDAEEILKRLGIPYRVVALCTGDMGFASQKTYDLEVWMPARKGYLEISSCSNCGDFQARRSNIRFRREPKAKLEFVHTLNGSGLAVGRTVSAILENYQEKDGTVVVPPGLRPYMDGLERIS